MAILTLDQSSRQQNIHPNLLPCKISYNGPVNANERYWGPRPSEDASATPTEATQTAYFRGRKLKGKTVSMPEGYEGVVLQKTDRTILEQAEQQSIPLEDDDFDEAEGPPLPKELQIIEQVGSFHAITVWDHEAMPSSSEDPYLKGVEEWLKMASAIHGDTPVAT